MPTATLNAIGRQPLRVGQGVASLASPVTRRLPGTQRDAALLAQAAGTYFAFQFHTLAGAVMSLGLLYGVYRRV
jgi:hypothetical protein